MQQTDKASGAGKITHQSLERGLRVLESIAASGGPSSLAETARRTGLHRSTAHHLLQTLVGLHYLHQDQTTRSYELSAKLFKLAGRTWTPEQLGEIATPFLAELTGRTGEASSLAAYRDGTVILVAKRQTKGPVRIVQSIGGERPLHASAVGKAISAFLPEAEQDNVLSRCRFERYTKTTLTTRRSLDAELRRIRAAGVAQDNEEHLDGIRCIAAPVRAYHGRVIASICSAGPKSRLTRQRIRQIKPDVVDIATKLSERLGWDVE